MGHPPVLNQTFPGNYSPARLPVASCPAAAMRRASQRLAPILGLATQLVATGCTQLTDAAFCSNGCAAEQACDPGTQLCVDVRPEVLLVVPLQNAGFDGGQVPVKGTVRFFDGARAREVSGGLPDGGWLPLLLDGGGFDATLPVPIRDGGPYLVRVRAVDTADRVGEAAVSVRLDQVPPTGSFVPGDGARGTEPTVRVVFDEEVFLAGADPVIHLSPDGGIGRLTPSGYEVSGLAFLTTYTAHVEAGAAVDRLGNPSSAVGPIVFTTGASPPAGPTLVNAGEVLDVDATSDEDGVVTVVARIDGGTLSLFAWGTFDGRTGTFQVLDQASDATADIFQAVGASAADAGVPVLRTSGFFRGSLSNTMLRSAEWRAGAMTGSVSTGALALIPTGPSCIESPGADPVGLVVTGSPDLYQRSPGSTPLPVSTVPARLGLRSPSGWELLSYSFTSLDRVVFRPACAGGGSEPFAAQARAIDGVREPPRLSVALPDADRSLYVFDGLLGERVERCEACVGAASDAGCPPGFERSTRPGLMVATRRSGGRVLGAALADGGGVELLERDLELGCATDWQPLGVLPGSKGAIRWVPVLFGARPGAVYATPTQVRAEVLP
jgi:hypothetical protein